MKKSVIVLLIAVMVVSFTALIVLQITYMKSLVSLQTDEFDGAVRRSLSEVVYTLELEETRRYLENELEEEARSALAYQSLHRNSAFFPSIFILDEDSSLVLASPPVPPFDRVDRLLSLGRLTPPHLFSSDDLPTVLRDRYLYQKEVLDNVVLRILYEANDRPIAQRVDFNKLGASLAEHFSNNGLKDVPFHFLVSDKNGKAIYSDREFYQVRGRQPDYEQKLFTNDPGEDHAMLYLYFPTRMGYIRNPLGMFVPIIIFSIVLLFVFAFSAIVILRQKKLSDMKNDFINNMTHELKTPVSTISLASQMLTDGDVRKTPESVGQICSVINDESKRLGLLVEKVLQMSLFDRDKKSTLSFSDCDMHTVIETVAGSFRLKVSSCGGQLQTELKAENPMVLGDEMHLVNVIFNLLDNAVKYRSEERDLQLCISTRNENDQLVVEVSDNGMGIQKENLKKIFDRFYRVPSGNVHNVKGFGLGLAYVGNIIGRHNGTIQAESEYKTGTKFIIHLPSESA